MSLVKGRLSGAALKRSTVLLAIGLAGPAYGQLDKPIGGSPNYTADPLPMMVPPGGSSPDASIQTHQVQISGDGKEVFYSVKNNTAELLGTIFVECTGFDLRGIPISVFMDMKTNVGPRETAYGKASVGSDEEVADTAECRIANVMR